jgi:hypothetical protein
MRSALLASAMACLLACGSHATGGGMGDGMDAAWERVRTAPDADAQRDAVQAFVREYEAGGAPALQVSAVLRATGEKAAIDRALWERPGDYELTLRYGERRYVFVPLSSASLVPLLRE